MEEAPEIKPLAETKREAIASALQACDGNVSETARRLGIDRRTLYRQLHKYGLMQRIPICPTCGAERG